MPIFERPTNRTNPTPSTELSTELATSNLDIQTATNWGTVILAFATWLRRNKRLVLNVAKAFLGGGKV
jgi:hypothetical protein